MGSNQSLQEVQDDREESEGQEEEEEEEEEDEDNNGQSNTNQLQTNLLVKKVLEQEPEVLPCHASASPLSPQLSTLGTPRLGPSIKVYDPFNVLAPPPPLPPPPVFPTTTFSIDDDPNRTLLEVYLISHGECDLNLRPDIVGGRCDGVALTANGKRQARALAVFLNSQRVRFSAVYCSPLDRARSMAVSVCQEMNFAKEQIQSSDALLEMSMGHWEGCLRSETYTADILSLIERYQPDFSAPSGESLRQVEFRMVQFLNKTLLGLPEKLTPEFLSHHRNNIQGFSLRSSHSLTNSVHDRDESSLPAPHWDTIQRHRLGLSKKKSGKSRLQFVSNTGDHDADDEMSPREANRQTDLNDLNVRSTSSPYLSSSVFSCIGVFTHSLPIKCLVTGLLGCSPAMSHKICIEDSSVTVLQHSWKTGWQIKRLNDTTHLRLL
ncbi:hypothetical protein SLE2022_349830 [Rubroshorea leprosula]